MSRTVRGNARGNHAGFDWNKGLRASVLVARTIIHRPILAETRPHEYSARETLAEPTNLIDVSVGRVK